MKPGQEKQRRYSMNNDHPMTMKSGSDHPSKLEGHYLDSFEPGRWIAAKKIGISVVDSIQPCNLVNNYTLTCRASE
jgi:hypothetical protein